MSEGTLHIGHEQYQRLTPGEQIAIKDWVNASLDCDPGLIEWIELPDTPDLVNRAMKVNVLVKERSDVPSLLSELHIARIKTHLSEDLYAHIVDVCSPQAG
jgi:hypothetical protein